MSLPPRAQQPGTVLALAAVYFAAGKLGLTLAFVHPSATAVWAPTGIAFAAVLFLGRRVWPGILLGAFLVNVTTTGGGGPLVALGIAAGNTLEALAGAALVGWFAHGAECFDHPRDVILYAVLAAVVSTTIAATVGTVCLAVGGAAPWGDFGPIWLTWWLGDAGGDFVVAPLIILFVNTSYGIEWHLELVIEAVVLAALTLVVSEFVFGGAAVAPVRNYPLDFLLMPIFIWTAFRFGRRGAAVTVALVYGVAVHGTLHGYGPFGSFPPNDALLLLQVFTSIVAVTALTLAAVVLERRRVEGRLLELAVSDSLTGLANYRRLIDVLEAEVERSLRTERPFAVLFLDLDDLKKVNDRYGHLVGSRALVRVALVLRRACRAIDTAARYGGDEFALVLPETDEIAAEQVARRVTELLASDGEEPRVSVSRGFAVFPRDAASALGLLAVADLALYGEKGRLHA